MKQIHFFYLVITISLCACKQSPEDMLTHLNGYWEIADVTTLNGEKKTFTLSQNIDFFNIQDSHKGIRKKVQPDINGHFTTSQSSENITINLEDNLLVLTYTTAFDTWKETIIKASKDQLVLLSDNGTTYTYRRYEPILLTK